MLVARPELDRLNITKNPSSHKYASIYTFRHSDIDLSNTKTGVMTSYTKPKIENGDNYGNIFTQL